MSGPTETLRARLAECPLVAIIRGVTPDEVVAAVERLTATAVAGVAR